MTLALKMADLEYDAYENGFDRGHEAGLQVGLQQGLKQGIEQGIEQGLEQGIEQGLKQGAYKKALETAKQLLFYGDSPEKVAICTSLPLDVVQSLSIDSSKGVSS